MFTISSFGLKVKCQNVSELRQKLSHDFKSNSVAVHKKMPSGVVIADYVDVDDKGDVVYSYGNNKPYFNGSQINAFS
jgi:hypothetical protein